MIWTTTSRSEVFRCGPVVEHSGSRRPFLLIGNASDGQRDCFTLSRSDRAGVGRQGHRNSNGQPCVLCAGPGHSRKDKSLSVTLLSSAPDGFLVHPFRRRTILLPARTGCASDWACHPSSPAESGAKDMRSQPEPRRPLRPHRKRSRPPMQQPERQWPRPRATARHNSGNKSRSMTTKTATASYFIRCDGSSRRISGKTDQTAMAAGFLASVA